MRKSTEPIWQAIAHVKMINPLFPSLAFVASFLAAFGRLDRLAPVLCTFGCLLVFFGRVSVAEGCEKGRAVRVLGNGNR
jgi:hypothetical protein